MKQKTIFLTGVGKGIGRSAAVELAKRGHRVIATTHTSAGAEDLKQFAAQQNCELEVFTLDITNPEDREKIKNYELDVLINVAGIGTSGPLAEVSIEKLRSIFETNVFSTLAISQIAMSGMMQRKSGTVIFVSSLAGRIPIPFLSAYSMSKFALSGGVAAMRREVHRVEPNVYVSLVEPGSYNTGFNQRMQKEKYEWIAQNSVYRKLFESLKKDDARFARFENQSIDSIVKKVVTAAEARKPKLRYSSPWYQYYGAQALRILGF